MVKDSERKQQPGKTGSSLNCYVALPSVILFSALALYASWHNEPRYKEQQTENFNPHIPYLNLSRDTASPLVNVSDDLLSAERVKDKLPYPPHPARFLHRPQVLSTQCVSRGSHYWQLEAEGYWDIAVAYESIYRTGNSESSFGMNKESWSLTHKDGKLFAFHDGQKTELSKSLRYQRVAVTVGVQEGTVIFYEDSEFPRDLGRDGGCAPSRGLPQHLSPMQQEEPEIVRHRVRRHPVDNFWNGHEPQEPRDYSTFYAIIITLGLIFIYIFAPPSNSAAVGITLDMDTVNPLLKVNNDHCCPGLSRSALPFTPLPI
ncbi:E3 ubiquitin-protein ligase TRIM7-like [Clupea harengus]|uniref:E3 ubiquitin-protein ligase TRIM7-like n=1 Tax=Clupea harengus TaxID=7950 RepID=A0A6P8EXX7_CLUHA|nr:E3 ubiquitin-protein ligase TRIM7-like [Clupea harengus]